MIRPPQGEVLDPKSWAPSARAVAQASLVHAAMMAALAGGEDDDRLSLWLLAAAGLVPGLVFANAELVRDALEKRAGVVAVCALVASALMGIVQRAYANRVRIFVGVTRARREESDRILESHIRTMTQSIQLVIQLKEKLTDADFSEYMEALAASYPDFEEIDAALMEDWLACLPRTLRRWEARALGRSAVEPHWRRRWILRKRIRQQLALQCQFLFFLVFLALASVSIIPGTQP